MAELPKGPRYSFMLPVLAAIVLMLLAACGGSSSAWHAEPDGPQPSAAETARLKAYDAACGGFKHWHCSGGTPTDIVLTGSGCAWAYRWTSASHREEIEACVNFDDYSCSFGSANDPSSPSVPTTDCDGAVVALVKANLLPDLHKSTG
jgi:hypothetical protein